MPTALAEIEAAMAAAWGRQRAEHPGTDPDLLADAIVADPVQHDWRLVEAALDRLTCPACDTRLGSGARGCVACDAADGQRFAAQEVDRPGVPPGNEHAIHVASAVLRAPARYPSWAVRANEVYLPLFLAGQMPTRAEQDALTGALRRGMFEATDIGSPDTFGALIEALAERHP